MLNKLYSYFFNKANLLRSSISKKEGESPWRVKTFAALYLFAIEIMEDFLKLLILIVKNPYDSFQLFTKQETLPICEYSYSDHKRFKKKVQLFSVAGISSIVAIALILNIILSLVVPGQLPSYAKTVNGGWDDWSLTNLAGDPPVGSAGSIAILPANTAEISGTGTASDLRLKSSSFAVTDDGTFSTTGSATREEMVMVDSYTKLFLRTDGTDGSPTFTDETGKYVTRVGDAQIDTAQSKIGGASALFDGTGDYLTIPDSDDWDMGTGDFTLEGWVRVGAIPSASRIVSQGNGEVNNGDWTFGFGTTWGGGTKINFAVRSGGIVYDYLSSAITININTWHHLAVTRSGTTLYFFLDGVQAGTATATNALTSARPFYVGVREHASGFTEYMNGWLDEIRVSKGIARWTADFTPPNYTYGASTLSSTTITGSGAGASVGLGLEVNTYNKLLLHADGTDTNSASIFTDETGKDVTTVGDAQIDNDVSPQKFSQAAKFDGNGDALRITSSDFNIVDGTPMAIDLWIRLNALPSSGNDWNIINQATYGVDQSWYLAYRNIGGIRQLQFIAITAGTPIITYNIDLSINTWYHLAVTKDPGNTFRMFLDGALVGTPIVSTGFAAIGYTSIGNLINSPNAGWSFNGWMDEIRFSQGTARWTANFTSPTSAYSKLTSGTFESATIDLGAKANLGNLDWTATIPLQTQTSCTVSTGGGCALKLQVATSDSSTGPWTYYGPDGATGTYFTSSGTAIPSSLSSKRYFRYKAYLATADISYTPTLDSVTLNYTQYSFSSTVTNLKFNTGYTGLTWASVSWVVSNPADIGSTVKVKAQARVAANDTALGLATFAGYGYNGSSMITDSSVYFDPSVTGQTNCSSAEGKFGDGDATKKTYTCQINQSDTTYLNKADPDRKWLELKLVLEGDIYTPQIDAARATFAINNEPEVCVKLTDDTTCDTTVTNLKKIVEPSPFVYLDIAQDQSDQYGNIIFDAYIRDPDTNTGAVENQGFVYVGLEHTNNLGAFGNATDSVIPPVSSSMLYYDATGDAGKGRFASATNLTITPKESGFANCELTGWTDYRAGFRYKCPVYTSTPNKYARYTFKWKIGNYNENGVFSGDFQDLALASNFKIRLVTYDGEGANSVNGAARAVSNGFTADTKKPVVTVNSTIINAAPAASGSGTIGWLPSVTDDNTMQYKLSDDGSTWPASWSNYSNTVLHDFAESTDRTTTLYYRLKDAYGNETAPASVTTLQRPHNLTLIDVSNIKGDDTSKYSYANFISWNLIENPSNRFNSYIVYRCIRDESTNPADYCDEKTNYSIINTGQNTALSTNSFTDYLSSADKEKLIYYRVASKDNNGNISGWLAGGITTAAVYGKANGKLDYGEGGGGGDGEPPKILVAPSFTNKAQTSANVIWTTDELATGGVFYSKNSTNYNLEKSTLAYQTTGYDATTDPSGRTIALTGLDASSIYNIRLKSVDASGNITICDSATAASQATDSVTGRVTYINQSGYCPAGATADTYRFTTLEKDVTPPIISAVTISDVDHESAKIVWTTDENSDSCVSFDTAAAGRTYGSGQCASGQIKSHTVTLAGLTAATTYYIKVKSQDSEKNLADKCSLEDNTDCPSIGLTDANYAFTTTAAPPPEVITIVAGGGGGGGARGKQDFTAPVISGITVADITDQSAIIAWTTDEKSSSFVQYGTSENLLSTTGGQLDEVTSHKVVLKNLNSETEYFFKATSVDWAGNIGSSNILNFSTEKAPTVEEEISKISGIEAQEKTKEVLEKLEEQIKAQKDDIVDPLQALLDALSPFINEPIIIGESPEIEVNSTTATIKWRTDKKSTSFVALAREDEFDDKATEPYKMIVGNPEDSVKEHKVEITGLLPATKYHYQVRSKALIGDTSRSKDFTFTTKSELPQVVSFLQKKTENEKTAVIYWETSVPTDSVVKYTPYVEGRLDPKQSQIQGKPDMVTGHEITLTNLDPGTIYQIEVSGRDPFANATAKTLPDFTTAIDKDAPVISQVRIESAMISGKTPKIQTIVSFRTDEPATSQVSFVEGGQEKFKQLPPNPAFATTHTFVITDFKPASIYRIRVEAIDESGNLAVSRDFTILTPAQSQSIIDIIVKTFENTFGWVKNVRF